MHALPDILRRLQPQPTHALFLAFDASPPFVDSDVWGAIVSSGLRDMTIIVDSLTLHNASIDAGSTRRAGVFYRLTGVRAHGGGLFHPKLACLVHPKGVHVLIGSANLTWSGWCRNLEIVDLLSFGANAAGAPSAARTIAELLELLPSSVRGLMPDDLVAIDRVRQALVSAAGEGGGREAAGCEVLHNLREPLLDQLCRRVASDSVDQIATVSPFYDPVNTALAKFAAAFPRAKLDVIKDGRREDDFDGPSLKRISRKARLYVTAWAEAPRPLHAKIVCLDGAHGSWLAAGSANLTSPAWIKSSANGGNVELITLRHAPRPRGGERAAIAADVLLADLPREEVRDVDALRFAQPESGLPDPNRVLHVHEATERDGHLSLRWCVPRGHRATGTVSCELRSQDRSLTTNVMATSDGEEWRLELDLINAGGREFLDDDLAIVARITQEVGDESLLGSAWVRRLGLLGQSPEILDLRQRLRALSGSLSNRPEDLLNGIAALIQAAQREPDSFDISGGDDDSDPGMSAGSDQPPPRRGLTPALRPLIMPQAPASRGVSRRTGTRASTGGQWEDDENEEQLARHDAEEVAEKERVERAEQLVSQFRRLADVARAHAQQSLSLPASPAAGRMLSATSGILLSGLVVAGLTLRQSWLQPSPDGEEGQLDELLEMLRSARQELWSLAFSLRGWETGNCAGWFPRVRGHAEWPTVRSVSFGQPAVVARVLADLLEQLTTSSAPVVAPEDAYVLQMLGVDVLPPAGDIARRIDELLIDSGVSPTEHTGEPLVSRLKPAGLADLTGWERLQGWRPVLEFINEKLTADQAIADLPDVLRAQLSVRLKRPNAGNYFASVEFAASGARCSGCDTLLPTQVAQRLRGGQQQVEECSSCARVLIPLDASSSLVRAVLAADVRASWEHVSQQ